MTGPASGPGPRALIASVGLWAAVIPRPLTRRPSRGLERDVVAPVWRVRRTGGSNARGQLDRRVRAGVPGGVSDRHATLSSARCLRVPRPRCGFPMVSACAAMFVDCARATGRRLLRQRGRGCVRRRGPRPWDPEFLDQGGVDHEPHGDRDCGEDGRRDEIGESMHAQSAIRGRVCRRCSSAPVNAIGRWY
jgi:hypothetical protein